MTASAATAPHRHGDRAERPGAGRAGRGGGWAPPVVSRVNVDKDALASGRGAVLSRGQTGNRGAAGRSIDAVVPDGQEGTVASVSRPIGRNFCRRRALGTLPCAGAGAVRYRSHAAAVGVQTHEEEPPVMRKLLVAGLTGLTVAAGAAAAVAQTSAFPSVTVKATVSPSKAGTSKHPQAVKLATVFHWQTLGAANQPIVTQFHILFPKGSLYNGAHTPTCSVRTLDRSGPNGCSKSSIMGSGTGTAYADTTLTHPAITVVNGGGSVVYFYTVLNNPARVQEPVVGHISRMGGKWAYSLSVTVPNNLRIVAGVPIELTSLNVDRGQGQVARDHRMPVQPPVAVPGHDHLREPEHGRHRVGHDQLVDRLPPVDLDVSWSFGGWAGRPPKGCARSSPRMGLGLDVGVGLGMGVAVALGRRRGHVPVLTWPDPPGGADIRWARAAHKRYATAA